MSQPIPIVSPTRSAHLRRSSNAVEPSPAVSLLTRGMEQQAKLLQPLGDGSVKMLLLENISPGAVELLKAQGWDVDHRKTAMSEDELVACIADYHAIGIRSKTKITAKVLAHATKLVAIGCFCIGTNQVDLSTAATGGVAVFNSPFANSRSVAELVIGEMVCLSRQLTDRSSEMRSGLWNKVSKGCWEIRGKTLGIVGYGHIGSQLSVLSEALGVTVIYHDVNPIMPLGSARQVENLEELLSLSDFVTLHVPELPETTNMIGASQLELMKEGSYLINNSRGKVVNIPALIAALKSKHLAGAAIDVFPAEPGANGQTFNNDLNSWASELQSCSNLIMTPHIGGSTEEAQRMIGTEVSQALIRYLRYGSSQGAVNFPQVDLRPIVSEENLVRLCYVHKNIPGVLRQINEILSSYNVEKQFSDSKGDIAYLMADISDVDRKAVTGIFEAVTQTQSHIATRVLQ